MKFSVILSLSIAIPLTKHTANQEELKLNCGVEGCMNGFSLLFDELSKMTNGKMIIKMKREITNQKVALILLQ